MEKKWQQEDIEQSFHDYFFFLVRLLGNGKNLYYQTTNLHRRRLNSIYAIIEGAGMQFPSY